MNANTFALRFNPQEDYAVSRFNKAGAAAKIVPGKYYAHGYGFVEYHIRIPDDLPLNQLESVTFICEIAAKAGREKVDWAQRVHPEDYPQTDSKKFPTTVRVFLNHLTAADWYLPDDPADARGALSHRHGADRGSYGYLREFTLTGKVLEPLKNIGVWKLRFEVPESMPGGIAIYGEDMGCYPVDPVLLLKFRSSIAGRWDSSLQVAVNRFIDRQKALLPTAKQGGTPWRYTTTEPADDWMMPEFDDSDWQEGKSGFGTQETPGARIGTVWNTNRVWLRKSIELPPLQPDDELRLEVHHDEDCEIYVNGKRLWREGGYLVDYKTVLLTPEQRSLFQPGKNLIAVSCRQTGGGQFIDVGLTLIQRENK